MKCKITMWVAMLLTVIGALNWGLWGFFQFDLVAWLFKGSATTMSRVVYSIIGLAGLFCLKKLCCCHKKCSCGCSHCCKDQDSHKTGCCR